MNEIVKSEIKEWSVEQIKEQVGKVQALMSGVLVKEQHFGVIPGTKKPSLYKPGAEKLIMMFRLAPKYEIESVKHDNGHIEYRITCSLHQIGSNDLWAQGVGSCSTLESKYRYRGDSVETDRIVPKAYWDNKDISLIGGKGHFPKKNDEGHWKVFKKEGRMENPDIADQYNTVLKMAKKRAMVDATIAATGASDIFTQDMEDFRDLATHIEKPAEKTVSSASVVSFENTNLNDQEVFEAIQELPEEIRNRMTAIVSTKHKTKTEMTQLAVDCKFEVSQLLEKMSVIELEAGI